MRDNVLALHLKLREQPLKKCSDVQVIENKTEFSVSPEACDRSQGKSEVTANVTPKDEIYCFRKSMYRMSS